ncbi:anaerobic ribonucleoside-triphosphate reductase [Enterococcus casseliflavus]|uniref:anaerobic ribonucleoside-triphosphate reductase n=1 Tax=Enterococcus casseliflavus TaxID=37734 RepID=UPI0030187CE6
MIVVKKDGSSMDYDSNRILRAVTMAIKRTGDSADLNGLAEQVLQSFESFITNKDGSLPVEIDSDKIRNIVESTLMGLNPPVATSYIEYRHSQDIQRKGLTDVVRSVSRVKDKDASVVNENANKDSERFNVERDLTAGSVAKTFGLKILPKKVANAHIKGDIHFHDLDYMPYAPMTNCCLIDFEGMLKNGFEIGNAEVESPKSIQTAVAQVAQIIANVSSSQYGGCSFDRADEVLAPYARMNFEKHKQKAEVWGIERTGDYALISTVKDIEDAIQSLEYEINTLYNANGQTPFVTLGFGLGTEILETKIQEAIFKVRMKGLGSSGKTAIFPKLVFTLKRGLNLCPNDPNYHVKQLALECSAKRMYPDILSYDKIKDLTGGGFRVPMGCRSFLQTWRGVDGNEINSGRMNLGVTTLNLPRIAIMAHGSKANFWKTLDNRMAIIKEACAYRISRVKEATPKNAPILYQAGAFGRKLSENDQVWDLFKNRRATISVGYIGMYEVVSQFYGSDWETNDEAKAFSLDILRHMKELADQWCEEFDVHVSIYSTPSESLTDRFCRMDTEKFGIIKDVTDKEYYTNSFHYDVRKKPTPFEKIDFEMDYPQYCSGGFIHYCEYPKLTTNLKALENVWDYAYDRVGYLGTNTPIDKCYECNYEGDFAPTDRGFKCPQCGNKNPKTSDVVKRTCGYLGNPQARPMVKGRHKEISARVKHMELKNEC